MSSSSEVKKNDLFVPYLTIETMEYSFGIKLDKIIEVSEKPTYRAIPKTTDYFLGISNIRGQSVGVLDLAKMLGISNSSVESDELSVFISFACGAGILGIVVKSLGEIMKVNPSDINLNPPLKSKIPSRFLNGIIQLESQIINLLDLDVLSDEDDIYKLLR